MLFNLGGNYKREHNDIMHGLVELLMNSLYGENVREGNIEEHYSKSELWMSMKYDERVL